jgi:vacuole morphology and inheritance protein 14
VAESASVYIPQYPETERVRERIHERSRGVLVAYPDGLPGTEEFPGTKKAFSLSHFIPLLSDRIYVVSPFTRSYLVSWITVLDSVPELELISYLPEFLDGLLSVQSHTQSFQPLSHNLCRKYLSDPTEDVKIATETILAELLREIRDVTLVRRRHEEQLRNKKINEVAEHQRRAETPYDFPSERALFISENDGMDHVMESASRDEFRSETDYRDSGGTIATDICRCLANATSLSLDSRTGRQG